MLSAATNKSVPELVNKKLYFVARRAVWYTHIASFFKIAQELGQRFSKVKTGRRKGKLTMKKGETYNTSRKYDAPLAAILVNFYRGKTGHRGLRGAAMKTAVQKFVGARMRSIGFLKAGWIAARDSMKKKARIKAAPDGAMDGKAKRAGVARLGGAAPARYDMSCSAAIWNQASYGDGLNPHTGNNYKHNEALMKYGLPALERAFAEETADTKTQLIKEINASAKSIGIRTN